MSLDLSLSLYEFRLLLAVVAVLAINDMAWRFICDERPRIWISFTAALGLSIAYLLEPTGWGLIAACAWVAITGGCLIWSAYWVDVSAEARKSHPLNGGNH